MTKTRSQNSKRALLIAICCATAAFAQPAAKTTTAVPRLVKFSGTLTDGGGKPLNGVVGVTFALYEDQEGGSPIWTESQNLQAGGHGEYEALLGSTRNDGIPAEVFGSGERWLGVQAQGETERPRVLMTSVPYSLKAVDSETLGGLPASAFALAAASGRAEVASGSAKPAATPAAITGSGTDGSLALWTGAETLGTSLITQNSGFGTITIGGTGTAQLFVTLNSISARSSKIGVQGEATGSSGTVYGVEGSMRITLKRLTPPWIITCS
jgi:hypothetical protein